MRGVFFFYGSLRRGAEALDAIGLRERMVWRGEGAITGRLYDLGDYPGLMPGKSRVVGDLFEVREGDAQAVRVLDAYEDHFEDSPDASLFRRRWSQLESGAFA